MEDRLRMPWCQGLLRSGTGHFRVMTPRVSLSRHGLYGLLITTDGGNGDCALDRLAVPDDLRVWQTARVDDPNDRAAPAADRLYAAIARPHPRGARRRGCVVACHMVSGLRWTVCAFMVR